MGYAKIACCDRCGKKRYVERINGRWLCLDCQDADTEEQPSPPKLPVPSNLRAQAKNLERP
jgi:ribosomal protein L37AE/L43A